MVNTFHVELDALSSVSNWSNIANEIHTGVGTEYLNHLPNTIIWDDISVQTEPIKDPGSQVGVHTVSATGTRNVLDANLAYGLCILAAVKTDTPKRYARGRMFMPPAVSEAATSDQGVWNVGNAYWTTANTFLNKLKTGFTVGDNSYQWVIYSRRREQLGASPVTFPVTAYQMRSQQHFLRSRMTNP